MKTAVYIPDDIFILAEKIARHLKITRSEFYSRAIKEYLEDVEDENLTQRLNSVYVDKNNSSKIDKKIHRAQLNILEKEEW
jgi:metal-responsive CopG/Arc/MetJ family transcriptional regulator